MKVVFVFLIVLISSFVISAQEKGVDKQTKTIKKSTEPTNRGEGVSRTFDFGSGKTKVRRRHENPYRMPSRRDVLVMNISNILTEGKFLIDESASRFDEGLIVTQPKIFASGPILTKNELNRYAIVPATDQIWTRGRYSLTIDVRSIDGIQNDISVIATIEGRSENGIFSEWSTLESSGVAEDEFLSKLIEYVGGESSKERKP
ncbi:MAG: hypothetical protein HKN33_12035 [Pyrinomonadaceae bacterium]|nr:hypothetical protein [Pyrinomonadaceae bacterium]